MLDAPEEQNQEEGESLNAKMDWFIPGPEYIRHTDYEGRRDQHHGQILVPHLRSNQVVGCLIDFDFGPRTGCGPKTIASQSFDFA